MSTTGSSQSLHRSRHADDYFFLSMALLVLGTVFVGFAPTYYMAGVFHAKLPSLLVHAHGAVFSSWIILLLAQTILISAGRVTWHKRLGILGIVLAVLMFILGFATLVAALRRHFEAEIVAEQIFSYDALHLSLFALLVLWAVLVRTDGPAHKRLMLLATVAILGPALDRWPFKFLTSNNFVFFGTLDMFLVFMVVFDLWSRRRLHRVTVLVSLIIVVLQFSFIPIANTALWHQFMQWVQTF